MGKLHVEKLESRFWEGHRFLSGLWHESWMKKTFSIFRKLGLIESMPHLTYGNNYLQLNGLPTFPSRDEHWTKGHPFHNNNNKNLEE
jgi:hypothetical protein